jgi:serine/threonine protein kinase
VTESPYRYLGKIVEGRYVLDQFLGDGATGYVYRARAVQIHRKFACKIVDTRRYKRKEFEEELLRRFRLEVEAMSRLRNPHVVAIYEAMQLTEGVFALLMDYVEGRTLQDLLDRVGRIKMDRALDIIRQVANGVYEAHRVGFIHRDLKPDNIMIERLPASGFFARILDFGIVHVMGAVDATQGFRGTPLYASPEQCMGDPGIDNRSDIYSLGCVFFHCVTGQPPFPGTESLRVMDSHVNEESPKVRDVLTSSHIPPGLEDLIARMLAKEPGDRPRDLSEVIRAIDEVMRSYEQPRKRSRTNPGVPPVAAGRTMGPGRQQFAKRARVSTGEFPQLGEEVRKPGAKTAGHSQAISPLIEYQLPEKVADGVVAVTAVALSETGDAATVADQLNRVHVLSLKNDGEYHTLVGANGLIVSVHYDSSHSTVYGCERDGTVLRWELSDPTHPHRIGKAPERVYALNAARDGSRVLCGTERGRVIAMDAKTGATTALTGGGQPISALGLSGSENKLLVGYWGGKLSTIHLGNKSRQDLEVMPKNPQSIVVSKDGYLAAALDEDGNVRILSMHDGNPLFTVAANAGLRALAFASDGQLLGLGVYKTTLQLWEIQLKGVGK